MSLHDPAGQTVVEQQVARAVRDRLRRRLGSVESPLELRDLLVERSEAP